LVFFDRLYCTNFNEALEWIHQYRSCGMEASMKVELRITKNGAELYAGLHNIKDSESFGRACADAWQQVQRTQLNRETSIGAVLEHVNDSVVDQLDGASISVTKV
jgi:hypothetical protein